MVYIKLFRLIHLASYVLVSAQLLFYLLVLSDALKMISLENFLEQRKVIDGSFGNRIRYSYYVCLFLSFIAVIISAWKPASPVFISSIIAFVFLIADVLLATRGNIPINAAINSYTPGSTNFDWEDLKLRWLALINYRACCISAGVLSLLCGLVINQDR